MLLMGEQRRQDFIQAPLPVAEPERAFGWDRIEAKVVELADPVEVLTGGGEPLAEPIRVGAAGGGELAMSMSARSMAYRAAEKMADSANVVARDGL